MTRMTDRAFVDTNVLVYAVDSADRGKQRAAQAIFAEIGERRLVLSTQVLSEFYVVATRKLATPMSEEAAASAVAALSKLPVVVADVDLVALGIAISREAQLSYWDGLIVAAAKSSGCESVLTEDLKAGSTVAGVVIVNPFLS